MDLCRAYTDTDHLTPARPTVCFRYRRPVEITFYYQIHSARYPIVRAKNSTCDRRLQEDPSSDAVSSHAPHPVHLALCFHHVESYLRHPTAAHGIGGKARSVNALSCLSPGEPVFLTPLGEARTTTPFRR